MKVYARPRDPAGALGPEPALAGTAATADAMDAG